jgi:hypothetical protein
MITAQKVYTMLGNESLWDAAKSCHALLTNARIPYAIVGGVAVCLHGYQRNTIDVDLLVQRDQAERVRNLLTLAGFRWNEQEHEFRTPSGVAIHFLEAGNPAGKNSAVHFPDPSDPQAVSELEGLFVLSLARLIESKIACGESNLRRTHKDFADVVELIAKHDLGRDFARNLHRSVRGTFRKLIEHGRAD